MNKNTNVGWFAPQIAGKLVVVGQDKYMNNTNYLIKTKIFRSLWLPIILNCFQNMSVQDEKNSWIRIGTHKNTSAQLNAYVYQSRLNSVTIPIKTFGILCWSNLNFNLHYYILNRIFWTLQVKRSTGEDLPSVFWFLNSETSNKWTSFRPSVEVCFVKKIWEEKRERSCSPLNKCYPP